MTFQRGLVTFGQIIKKNLPIYKMNVYEKKLSIAVCDDEKIIGEQIQNERRSEG